MKISKSTWKNIGEGIFQVFFFGLLAYLSGLVKFTIPGMEGAVSNMAEIALLISVFHVKNPLITLGICIIYSFATPPDGSYLSTLISHYIPLIIIWLFYKRIFKTHLNSITLGTFWFVAVFAYYLLLILPLMIWSNYLFGLNLNKDYLGFYEELVLSVRLELFATAIVTSLYLLQFTLRIKLRDYNQQLESIVKKRTEDLSKTIEELKTTQENLVQSEKMASLGILTAGVAHEINNPLNFINGGINIISEINQEIKTTLGPEQNDKCNKAINSIETGLGRATEIVQALMAFSSPEKSELVKSNINHIIDTCLLFLNHKNDTKIEIQKNYLLQSEIAVFPEKIHQVIVHILDNAFDELNTSGSNGRKLIIGSEEKPGWAVITIFNTGKKIPENELIHIFDPFFTTKAPGKGKGLGLSICYTLIQEHKGKIYAQNKENGVCFTVEIPTDQTNNY